MKSEMNLGEFFLFLKFWEISIDKQFTKARK